MALKTKCPPTNIDGAENTLSIHFHVGDAVAYRLFLMMSSSFARKLFFSEYYSKCRTIFELELGEQAYWLPCQIAPIEPCLDCSGA